MSLQSPQPGLFDNISWSTPQVLEQSLKRARSEQLSVRATERLVAERIRNEDDPHGLSQTETTTKTGDGSSREHLVPLEQKLRSALGTSVDIREVAKGRGTIAIHFTSREEFDRLYHELLEREGRDRRAGERMCTCVHYISILA